MAGVDGWKNYYGALLLLFYSEEHDYFLLEDGLRTLNNSFTREKGIGWSILFDNLPIKVK